MSDQADTLPENPTDKLPPAARRALAEAAARRKAADTASASAADALPKELGGRREGLEPVRYGDWEKKGIAVDF